VGVTALVGEVPKRPETVNAAMIRALRHPSDGSGPCGEGLAAALAWIGDRELPFDAALAEAKEKIDAGWLTWALEAIGSGSGSGYGYGSGYGSGYGDGSGSGYGSGYGYGYGDGSGYGDG
jgi:hypothetical protein